MHSSTLGDSDFEILASGRPVALAEYFRGFTNTIWPEHKDVLVGTDAVERLNAITDRGVNILLVPDGPPVSHEYQRQQVAAAERLIETCYAYSATGAVADPDVVIRCPADPLADWCQSVCDSVPDGEREAGWQGRGPVLEQSFRRISRQDALARLA